MAIVFRFHLLVGLVVCAAGVGWLALGRGKIAAASLAGCAIVPALVCWWPVSRVPDGRPTILIMSANLLYSRADFVSIRRQIEEHTPDMVLFQEFTPDAQAALGDWLRGVYPHYFEHAQEGAYGQAVYSRLSLAGPPRVMPPGLEVPQVTLRLNWEGRPLSLTNVHLYSPVVSQAHAHRTQAARLASWLESLDRAGGDVVAAGDWNATWHTPHMARLANAGFHESHEACGVGRGSTWPRVTALAFAPGIRIDHVVYNAGLECIEAWVGDDVSSDHAPVFARLARRPIAAR